MSTRNRYAAFLKMPPLADAGCAFLNTICYAGDEGKKVGDVINGHEIVAIGSAGEMEAKVREINAALPPEPDFLDAMAWAETCAGLKRAEYPLEF